jgi:hypothetical protein
VTPKPSAARRLAQPSAICDRTELPEQINKIFMSVSASFGFSNPDEHTAAAAGLASKIAPGECRRWG